LKLALSLSSGELLFLYLKLIISQFKIALQIPNAKVILNVENNSPYTIMKKKYHQRLKYSKGGDKRMDSKGRILIRGGTVVDPASNVLGQADVLIHNDKIAADSDDKTDKVIDAAGCLILPGLIDYHTHLFYSHSKIGINPDLALLPQGITTAVDQGSAGVTNAADFLKLVVDASQVRLFAHLNVSPAGLTTLPDRLEDADPGLYDLQHSHGLIANHDRFIGLKIRQGESSLPEY
jgi:predicted amidohydrolase